MADTNATGGVAVSSNFRQILENEIKSQISTNFLTLGGHPQAVNYVLGIIGVESGKGYSWKNVSIKHAVLSGTSGIGKAYEKHPLVKAARARPVINQTNVTQGRQAHSLLGCLGAYLIRGLESGEKSFPHVQGSYKEIAEGVGCLVNVGESISALFTEDLAGLRRGLVPGLCVMEYNYKIALRQKGGNKDQAMALTIRRHLGDPNAADSITGISSSDYLARVMNNANAVSSSSGGREYASVETNSSRSSPESSGVTSRGTAPGCAFTS